MRQLLLPFAFGLTTAVSLRADAQFPPSIEFRVPKPPTLAAGDSGSFLAYELHVTNITPALMQLKRVEVLDGDNLTRSLLALADTGITRVLTRPGSNVLPSQRSNIAGGSRAMVFLWVPLPADVRPATVRHRLTFQPMKVDSVTKQPVAEGEPQVLEGAVVRVDHGVPRIDPPLRGEWVAANGPSNQSGHRRTQLALGGTVTIPQRFAIDFLQVNDSGITYRGDRSRNENFIAYGMEALAVADGIIVQTKDSIPENTGGPMSRAVPITLETVGGNHVVLEIGRGQYAFYAHLQPGSLRVRVGDRVKRGQVIGLVGNSGNSTEPHLHFHLVDAIAPGTSTLGAEGIPYAFPALEVVGRCVLAASVQCTRTAPIRVSDAMPLQNQLVRFLNQAP
jgi:murein DD-endopeptidase